jgi:hypothetical protein
MSRPCAAKSGLRLSKLAVRVRVSDLLPVGRVSNMLNLAQRTRLSLEVVRHGFWLDRDLDAFVCVQQCSQNPFVPARHEPPNSAIPARCWRCVRNHPFSATPARPGAEFMRSRLTTLTVDGRGGHGGFWGARLIDINWRRVGA